MEKPNYRHLFTIIDRAMYYTRENGEFIEVNSAFEELVGYSADDLQKMTAYDLFTDNDQREYLKDKIIDYQFINDALISIRTKGGEIRLCHDTAVLVEHEDGSIGYQGMLDDVTEQMQNQKQLQLLQRAVNQSLNVIIITDSKGDIEFVNDQFTKITGYEKDEVIGENPRILKSEKNINTNFKELWDTIREGNVWKGYFRNRTKGGNTYWARSTISPVFSNDNGEITHYIDVQEDITEEKLYKEKLEIARQQNIDLQEKLFQNEKLQAIGRLAGGISHDFNNILTIIDNNVEVLKLVSDDEEVISIADIIGNTTQRASRLISRLLNYSRRSSYEFNNEYFSNLIEGMNEIIDEIIHDDISVKYQLDAEEDLVKIDRGGMENVIINMILNAQEAMPNGGTIILKTENGTISSNSTVAQQLNLQEGKYLVVKIIDEGVGISDNVVNKLFEPFFTTKSSGVGLGLASAYGTIKSHQGTIEVSSELDKGTTMTLYLPLVQETTKKKTVHDGQSKQLIEHIMMIDDEELILDSLAPLLKQHHNTISTFTSSYEALNFYENNYDNVDLVILDLNMPSMSGLEVFEQLKKINPDIKVLIYSGHLDDTAMNFEDSSIIGKISKPADSATILDIINNSDI